MSTVDELHKKWLEDPEYREEYEKLDGERMYLRTAKCSPYMNFYCSDPDLYDCQPRMTLGRVKYREGEYHAGNIFT